MIYPKNFERKIGYDEVRTWLKGYCLSTLGKSIVEAMDFSADFQQIATWMEENREMRRIIEEEEDFELSGFYDVRDSLKRVRLEGTWMEEGELFDLRRSLATIDSLVRFLYRGEPLEDKAESEEDLELKKWSYPALHNLADGIATFPVIIQQIDQIIDKYGHMRDSASPELHAIRQELAGTESSISRILNGILHSAQSEGLVEKDVTPTLRDGRLVIPILR